MNANEIFIEARRLLQDTEEPYRWSNERLHDALQLGINALASIRPETRYVDGLLTDGVMLPADDSASFPVNYRYKDALVCFVVHQCYADDSSDTVNSQLSKDFLAKFNSKAQL